MPLTFWCPPSMFRWDKFYSIWCAAYQTVNGRCSWIMELGNGRNCQKYWNWHVLNLCLRYYKPSCPDQKLRLGLTMNLHFEKCFSGPSMALYNRYTNRSKGHGSKKIRGTCMIRSCRGNRIDCRKLNSSCDCITQMPDAEINVLPK